MRREYRMGQCMEGVNTWSWSLDLRALNLRILRAGLCECLDWPLNAWLVSEYMD